LGTSTDSKTCTCNDTKFKKLDDTITCVGTGECTATSEKDGAAGSKECVCNTDYFKNIAGTGCINGCENNLKRDTTAKECKGCKDGAVEKLDKTCVLTATCTNDATTKVLEGKCVCNDDHQ